jgi:hypothetical protein
MIVKTIMGLISGLLLAFTGLAATYDEAMQGDLSDDGSAPTAISLDEPSNRLAGSITFGERDYFTISVPAGAALNKIILTRYESSNARAFIGVQAGSQVTLDPSGSTSDGLLGYMHFGFDQGMSSDLLVDLARSIPPGFSIPLPAGNYSFWLNQTEPAATFYEFNLTTVARLSGDYNNDREVNAADYTVWRNRLNTAGPLANETESIGTVDQEDYAAWKGNFGAAAGGGNLAQVDGEVAEPGTVFLMTLLAIPSARTWRTRS